MGRVVADRAVTLDDVVTVLREAGPVEQFEGRDVGVVDFERFAGKGITVQRSTFAAYSR